MSGIFGIISKYDEYENVFMTSVIMNKKHSIINNLSSRGSISEEFLDSKCFLLRVKKQSDAITQPYIQDDVVIIFDGFISNYDELRDFLTSTPDCQLKTDTTLEIIIKLYKKLGTNCIQKLNGHFAFCLYDTRLSQIYLFRDRFGIRPLYIYENDDVLIFSSCTSTILTCLSKNKNETDIKPSLSSISSYLSFGDVIGNETFFDKIRRMTNEHYIMIHQNVCQEYSIGQLKTDGNYFDFVPDLYDSIKNLKQHLIQSIKNNIPKDDKINVMLSGGIDSSVIVCIISDLIKKDLIQPKEILTYSIGFDNENEFEYSNIVSDKFCTTHTNIIVSTDEYLEEIINIINIKCSPLNTHYEPLLSIMSRKINESGYDVVLSGLGADELLHGNDKLFVSYYKYMNDSCDTYGSFLFDECSLIPTELKQQIMQYDDTIIKGIFEKCVEKCDTLHYQDKLGYVMLELLIQKLLSTFDIGTTCSSIYSRYPFLDKNVLEYCFYKINREHKTMCNANTSISQLMSLSTNEICDNYIKSKYILKEMFKKELPVDIIERKRNDFMIPIERILYEKYEIITKILEKGCINCTKKFNLVKITEHFKNHSCDNNEMEMIWLLLNLEIFFQLFIYNKSIENVKEFLLVDKQFRIDKENLLKKIIIPNDEQLKRYIKFYVVTNLMSKHNIDYFAFGKTLLGCVRHKGFIPWDDKIELIITEEQCNKMTSEFRIDLMYAGFKLDRNTNSSNHLKIIDFLDTSDLFTIDVFIGQSDNSEHIIVKTDDYKNIILNNADIYPLTQYLFGFYSVIGMKNSDSHFTSIGFENYMKSSHLSSLVNRRNNDLLHGFLQQHELNTLPIRDISLLTRIDNIVFTDDWNYYFHRAKENIPYDFNPHNYILLNGDIKNQIHDNIDAHIHYITKGRFESRQFALDSLLPIDFDVKGYRCLNPSLSGTDKELCAHYITLGMKQKLQYSINKLLPCDFDPQTYVYLNEELDSVKNDEAKVINHYINFGKNGNKPYTYNRILPKEFNYKRYIELNTDLQNIGITNERKAIIHYITRGRKENRNYK